MDEAEQLCDRLVIMDRGRIVVGGSPRSLIETHCTREVVELRFASPEELARAADRFGRADEHRIEALPDRLLVYADDGDQVAAEAAGFGAEVGLAPTGSLVRRSSLEDVFLTLTGRTLVEA
jgi:lipooligosaccharide transport system ATP-binding protein